MVAGRTGTARSRALARSVWTACALATCPDLRAFFWPRASLAALCKHICLGCSARRPNSLHTTLRCQQKCMRNVVPTPPLTALLTPSMTIQHH